jgi:uncharacterized protein
MRDLPQGRQTGVKTVMTISLFRLARPLLLAALLLGGAFGATMAFAQEIDPAQLALARKYVDLTNKGQVYEVILVQTAQKTSNLFVTQDPKDGDKINDVIGKILETYKGKHDDLFNQIARIYAVSFTPQEMQQIVDFYSSPAGQKLANSAANINSDVQKVMQVYTYNLGTEFVTKVRAELKAEGLTP